jgi:hypothetical protein
MLLPPWVSILHFGSTRNQRGNCPPILATVRLHCIFQFADFLFCLSDTRTFIRPVDAGMQDIHPSVIRLCFRSTLNQLGNCTPILATSRLCCILQLAVFDYCPFTRASSHQGDAGVLDFIPSALTLTSRSTRDQRGDCDPICYVRFTALPLAGIRSCMFSFASSFLLSSDLSPAYPSCRDLHLRGDLHQQQQHEDLLQQCRVKKARYCILVRPGTSVAIARQFLPPCVCTASFSLLTSFSVHLIPVRSFARSMLGCKISIHLL